MGLLRYAETDRQREVVEAVEEHGSQSKAAIALGIDRRTLDRTISRVKSRAALQGYAPEHDMVHEVPNPFTVKRQSICRDGDGDVKLNWTISEPDKEQRFQFLKDNISAFVEDLPKAKPSVPPSETTRSLMCVYPLGDPHIGMRNWAEETGDDFDLDIAERELCRAMDWLVASAPPADTGLVLNLGDFFHADDTTARTAKSGNVLDVDGRWAKVIRVGMRAMRTCIDSALEKHQNVEVRNCIGNHDSHTSLMLAAAMEAFYHNEPRVLVHMEPTAFWYRQFGKNLIASTHGDTAKIKDLGEIMATDVPELWGQTTNRYWYTGHIHHDTVTELRGCRVESFRTLAGRDAWHTAQGYRSGRDMKRIVLDAEYGEVERSIVSVEMLRGT